MINEKAGRDGDKVLSQAKPKTFMDIFRNPDLLNAFITDQCSINPSENQHFFEGYTTINGIDPANVCAGETSANEESEKREGDSAEAKQSEKCGVETAGGKGSKSAIPVPGPSSGYDQRQPSVIIMQQNVNVNSRNTTMSANAKNAQQFGSAKFRASQTSPSQQAQLPSRQYSNVYGEHAQRNEKAASTGDGSKCPGALAIRGGNSAGSVSAEGNTTVLSQMIGAQTNINVIVNQTIFDRHQKGDKALTSSDNHRSISIPIDSPLSTELSGAPSGSAATAKQNDKAKTAMDGDRSDARPKSKKGASRNTNKTYQQECVVGKATEPAAGNAFRNQVLKQQRRARSSQLTLQHLIGSGEDQASTLPHIGSGQGVMHYGFQKPAQPPMNDLANADYIGAGNAGMSSSLARPMMSGRDYDALAARNQADAVSQRVRMLQQFRQRSALLQLRQHETANLGGLVVGSPQNVIIADPSMPQLAHQLKVLQPSSGWSQPLEQRNKAQGRMYVQQAKDESEDKPGAYHQSPHVTDGFLNGQTSNRIFLGAEKQAIPPMQVLMLQRKAQSPNYKRIAFSSAEAQFGLGTDLGHQDHPGSRAVQRQAALGPQAFQLEGLQQQVEGYGMQRQQMTRKWECGPSFANTPPGMSQQSSANSRDAAVIQRRLVVQQSPSTQQAISSRCYPGEECQQMLKQEFSSPIARIQSSQRQPFQVFMEKHQPAAMPAAQGYADQAFNRQMLRSNAVEQLAAPQHMRPRIISSGANNNQQVFYCPVAISTDVYTKTHPSSYSPVQQSPMLMPAFVEDANWSQSTQMGGQKDEILRGESARPGKRTAPTATKGRDGGMGGQAKRQRRTKGSRAAASPAKTARQQTPVSTGSTYMPNLLVQHASNTIGSQPAQATGAGPMGPIDQLKQKIFQRVAQLNALQQQGYDVTALFADLRNKAAEAFARLSAAVGSQQSASASQQRSSPAQRCANETSSASGQAERRAQIALTAAAKHSLSLLPLEQQQQVMITLRKQQLQHNQMKLAELAVVRNAQSATGHNASADAPMEDTTPCATTQSSYYTERTCEDNCSSLQLPDEGDKVEASTTNSDYQQLRRYYNAKLPPYNAEDAEISAGQQRRGCTDNSAKLNSTDDMLVSKQRGHTQATAGDSRLDANCEQDVRQRTDTGQKQRPESEGDDTKADLSGQTINQATAAARKSAKAPEPAKFAEPVIKENISKDPYEVSKRQRRMGAEFDVGCNDGSRVPPGLVGSPYATPVRRNDGSTLWLSVGPLPIDDKRYSSTGAARSTLPEEDDRIDYDSILKDLEKLERRPLSSLLSRDGPLSAEQRSFGRKLARMERLLSPMPGSYSPESARWFAARVILGVGCPPELAQVPSRSEEEALECEVKVRIRHLKDLARQGRARREARQAEKERQESRRVVAEECAWRRRNPDLMTPFKDFEDAETRLHCYVAPYEHELNDFKYDVSTYPPLSRLDLQQRMMNVKQKLNRSRRRHFKRLNAPLPHTDAVHVLRSQIELERHMLEATVKSKAPPERPIKIKGKPEPLPSHLDSLSDVIKMPKRVKVNGGFVFKFDEADNWQKYFAALSPEKASDDRQRAKSQREIIRHLSDKL